MEQGEQERVLKDIVEAERQTTVDERSVQPFTNFKTYVKSWALNDDWRKLLEDPANNNYTCTFKLINIGNLPICNLVLIHSNLISQTHMYRMLYLEKCQKENKIQDWPIVSQVPSTNKINTDKFQLEFSIQQNGKKYTYQMGTNTSEDQLSSSLATQIIKKLKVIHVYIYQIKQFNARRLWVKISFDDSPATLNIQMVARSSYPELQNAALEHKKRQNSRKESSTEQSANLHRFSEYSILTKYQLQRQRVYGKDTRKSLEKDNKALFSSNDTILLPEAENEMTSLLKNLLNEAWQETTQFFWNIFKNQQDYQKSQVYCDIEQGLLGDCYYIASVDQIISKADFIMDKIWILFSKSKNYACCILNIDGRICPISVDLKLKYHDKKHLLKYAHFVSLTKSNLETRKFKCVERAILIEKCLAKVFNGYQNLDGGLCGQIFMMLTNHSTKVYPLFKQNPQKEYQQLKHKEKLKVNRDLQLLDMLNSKQNPNKQAPKPKPTDRFTTYRPLSNEDAETKQIIQIMKKWQYQDNLIKADYEQMISKSKQQARSMAGTFAFPQKSVQIRDKYHFITVGYFDWTALQTLFPQEKGLQYYTKHAYSFQGITWWQNIKDIYYIRLRQPRGQWWAQKWRTMWNKRFESNPKNYIQQQEIYYIMGERISFQPNEFILTFEQLCSLNAKLDVCVYDPQAKYRSIPLVIKRQTPALLKLKVKQNQPVLHEVTLHQRSKRHKYDAKQKSKVERTIQRNKWYYNKASFGLQLRPDFLVPFIDHETHRMTASFACQLSNNTQGQDYKLLVQVKQQPRQQFGFYHLSLLSRHNDSLFLHNNETTTQLLPQQIKMIPYGAVFHKFPEKWHRFYLKAQHHIVVHVQKISFQNVPFKNIKLQIKVYPYDKIPNPDQNVFKDFIFEPDEARAKKLRVGAIEDLGRYFSPDMNDQRLSMGGNDGWYLVRIGIQSFQAPQQPCLTIFYQILEEVAQLQYPDSKMTLAQTIQKVISQSVHFQSTNIFKQPQNQPQSQSVTSTQQEFVTVNKPKQSEEETQANPFEK